MRRVTKRLLVLIFGSLFTVFYCEYIIYYIVVVQCQWPTLLSGETETGEILKGLIISDPHLLGPRKGHWFDKMRREWQMHQAFEAIMNIHRPEAVFVLGDLFDEGEWSSTKQFNDYVARFNRLFPVPNNVSMLIAVGNHDIGFHNAIRRGSAERFYSALNTSSVRYINIKNGHFVFVNSMAMQGDSCRLCVHARKVINEVSDQLDCSKRQCSLNENDYTRPILMQHFPLYRESDGICTEPDAPPLSERYKKFRPKIDALSKASTEFLVSKIKPKVVFSGHTHHGCLVHHSYDVPEKIEFFEYSVPSFSWRNRPDPKYMLIKISPKSYAVSKCGLPLETTIVVSAVILLFMVVYCFHKVRKFR